METKTELEINVGVSVAQQVGVFVAMAGALALAAGLVVGLTSSFQTPASVVSSAPEFAAPAATLESSFTPDEVLVKFKSSAASDRSRDVAIRRVLGKPLRVLTDEQGNVIQTQASVAVIGQQLAAGKRVKQKEVTPSLKEHRNVSPQRLDPASLDRAFPDRAKRKPTGANDPGLDRWEIVKLSAPTDIFQLIQAFLGDSAVETAEPNRFVAATANFGPPNDPFFVGSLGLCSSSCQRCSSNADCPSPQTCSTAVFPACGAIYTPSNHPVQLPAQWGALRVQAQRGWDMIDAKRGDMDQDGDWDSTDVNLLIQAVNVGPPPSPFELGDLNDSGTLSGSDVTILSSCVANPATCNQIVDYSKNPVSVAVIDMGVDYRHLEFGFEDMNLNGVIDSCPGNCPEPDANSDGLLQPSEDLNGNGVRDTTEDLNGNGQLDTGNMLVNPGEMGSGKETNGVDDDGNGYVDDVVGYDFSTCADLSIDSLEKFFTCNKTKSRGSNPSELNGSAHGTHIAGTISAMTNNNRGIAGIAGGYAPARSEVKVLPVKAMELNSSNNMVGQLTDFVDAIHYAVDRGADVLNLSWVTKSPGGQIIADAIGYATSHGVVSVAAAGNYSGSVLPYTPASISDVITVANLAVDRDNAGNQIIQHYYDSKVGSAVDVAAPGEEILSLRPAPATVQRTPINPEEPEAELAQGTTISSVQTVYQTMTGTSMAAPHVAALAALVLQKYPTFTVDQVQAVIKMGAKDLNEIADPTHNLPALPGWDRELGQGVVNVEKTLKIANPLVAAITAPVDAASFVSGDTITVTGSAGGPGFASYTLDYTLDEPKSVLTSSPEWTTVQNSTTAVTNSTLGSFSQSAMGNYLIRLTVTDTSGRTLSQAKLVRVGLPNQAGWPQSLASNTQPQEASATGDLDPSSPGKEIITQDVVGHDFRAFRSNGTLLWGPFDTGAFSASSPAIADIDGNGTKDAVIVATKYIYVFDGRRGPAYPLPGWPKTLAVDVWSSPAIADVDPTSPGLEIVVADVGVATTGNVHVFRKDGTEAPGWPQVFSRASATSPAIANLDLDPQGLLEVIVGSWDGKVYAWHQDGTAVAGWPKLAGTRIFSSPAIGEFDPTPVFDPVRSEWRNTLEVIVGSMDGWLYAFHSDGSPVVHQDESKGFYVNGRIGKTDDITGDGNPDFPIDGSPVIANLPAAECNLACTVVESTVVVAARDGLVHAWYRRTGDGMILGQGGLHRTIVQPRNAGATFHTAPVVADLLTTEEYPWSEVVVAGLGGEIHLFGYRKPSKSWVEVPGWPQNLAQYVYSSPAATDVDGDGDAELVITPYSSAYVWTTNQSQSKEVTSSWSTARRDSSRTGLYNLCSDGTTFGQCSYPTPTSPTLCQRGAVVPDCTTCGCPSTSPYCNPETQVCEQKCDDGTPYNSCSTTKPTFKCTSTGQLVPSCGTCGGCPSTYPTCKSDGGCYKCSFKCYPNEVGKKTCTTTCQVWPGSLIAI